jgi:hypothetical protein
MDGVRVIQHILFDVSLQLSNFGFIDWLERQPFAVSVILCGILAAFTGGITGAILRHFQSK